MLIVDTIRKKYFANVFTETLPFGYISNKGKKNQQDKGNFLVWYCNAVVVVVVVVVVVGGLVLWVMTRLVDGNLHLSLQFCNNSNNLQKWQEDPLDWLTEKIVIYYFVDKIESWPRG